MEEAQKIYDKRTYFGPPAATGMSPYQASLYLFSKLYWEITERQQKFCRGWCGAKEAPKEMQHSG